MSNSERITLRLPEEYFVKIQSLVERGIHKTMSGAIRHAIGQYLTNTCVPEYIVRIKLDFPKEDIKKLEEIVNKGCAVSIDDAIRDAVREYLRNKYYQE